MQHILSDQITDFTAIYDENVELVSVTRPISEELEYFADRMFASRRVVKLQWQQQAMDTELPSQMLETSLGINEGVTKLAKIIILTNEILYELIGCKEIGVRVATLNTPMCPRFHVDSVVCRMLITIGGPGTEWIANYDVDRILLADRASEAAPIKNGKEIQRVTPGSMALLKGGTWHKDFAGVVHRSPHQEIERLLISFDPIYSI